VTFLADVIYDQYVLLVVIIYHVTYLHF